MIKGHAETMEKIEDLEKRIPLDRPEQFLFEMSQVPQLEERIACFIFEDTFKGFGSRFLQFVIYRRPSGDDLWCLWSLEGIKVHLET